MPRLLILSLNYAPEPTGFAPHTTALAEHEASLGFAVTVVTGFPFAPRWARWPEYKGRIVCRERVNGVDIVRVSHFIPRQPGSALQRVLMEGSFAAGAFIALSRRILFGPRFDLVLAVGAQPAVAWLARSIAALARIPYIVKITDLAAQAALDVGIVRNGTAAQTLASIELGAYRRACAAIVLCDAFANALVADGFPREAVHVIPDSVDLDAIQPDGDGARFRRHHHIDPGAFVVLYSGSLGLKQGLFDVVDAARLLAPRSSDVQWVLIGEGETRKALRRRIADARLDDRVLLLPLQPERDLRDMFAASDLLLLSQLRAVKDTVIPSKLLMYMAAGRPVVAAVNTRSQAANLIREANGGVVVDPENAQAMADAVLTLLKRPQDRSAMARRNRVYAEQHFDRTAILSAQQAVIDNACARDEQTVSAAPSIRPLD